MTSFDIMWKKSVDDMVKSIESNEEIYLYLLSFEPCEYTGYAWTTDSKYKEYSNYLDKKTGYVHSGASFACCVREAVNILRKNSVIVKATEVSEKDETIITITSSSSS
tara:strand:- start:2394 stop:2717 length:324 start_codon:yes stop_codon:yes gene_type:complete